MDISRLIYCAIGLLLLYLLCYYNRFIVTIFVSQCYYGYAVMHSRIVSNMQV